LSTGQLRSITPEELLLHIQSVDRVGTCRVKKFYFRSPTGWVYWRGVEFGFEFCPSLLPQIVSEFQRLVDAGSLDQKEKN
jgi:hypothetical protein